MDVEPNRLAAAQAAARTFVEEQPRSTRIGVVAFAATALVVQHPTQNRQDVIAAIDRLQLQRGTAIGSGVVIIDKGIILTSLHVVASADRVSVVFDDGTESEATIVVRQPERDIAVLWATSLPDNLVAATMRSTQDLVPGDQVIAVGFPFGIGPSVSAGVISGLRRQHRSISGDHMIEGLIQFDAAVNPGSSGGPLVTAGGEVVGIVSSILNPSNSNVFVGIGFAVPIENAASVAGTTPF